MTVTEGKLSQSAIFGFNQRVQSRVLKLAGEIIAASSRKNPADTVLRTRLREAEGLSREDGRWVSRAVFAYFRWRGWLDAQAELTEQIGQAGELANRFTDKPASFPDDEMMARAVPDWTAGQVPLTPDWVRALQYEPRLWLRARLGTGRKLSSRLGSCIPSREPGTPDTVEYRGPEDLYRTAPFHAGEFEIQDVSSQIVGLVCGAKPGETWWDACAGEGGKTLHLSDLMQNKGLIWASDRVEWRLRLLKQRAGRAQVFNYRAAIWDGGAKLPTKTKFDGILVDAPCSGLGTWQRNPHARWTTTLNDVQELAALQTQLLGRVAGSLKPGGKLVYSVCTLTRAETTEVAAAFEKTFPDLKPLPFTHPAKPDDAPAHPLWIWPQDAGGNGMFIAAWQR